MFRNVVGEGSGCGRATLIQVAEVTSFTVQEDASVSLAREFQLPVGERSELGIEDILQLLVVGIREHLHPLRFPRVYASCSVASCRMAATRAGPDMRSICVTIGRS